MLRETMWGTEPGVMTQLMTKLLILPIRAYQYLISPLLPPSCRFYPTCSRYAVQALQEHGPLKGLLLGSWRIMKCHPFHPGGYDPVPPRKAAHAPGVPPKAPPGA